MTNENKKVIKWLGILGMLLPVSLFFFNTIFGKGVNPPNVLQSISATHFSIAGLLFSCLVAGVGFFLLFYQGYDTKDRIVCKIAGINAMLLVFFPCTLGDEVVKNFLNLSGKVSNFIHCATAFLFFVALMFMIAFQFTKTNGVKTGRKVKRNNIYYVCAGTMACGLLIGGAFSIFGIGGQSLFWGEAVALWAFGIAWLTKGGIILKDL